MEIGVNGVNGALVLRHATRGSRKELVNATRQLQSMAENCAQEKQIKLKSAIRIFHVQVIIPFVCLTCRCYTVCRLTVNATSSSPLFCFSAAGLLNAEQVTDFFEFYTFNLI